VVKPQSGHRRRGISRRRLPQRPATVPISRAADRSTRRARRRRAATSAGAPALPHRRSRSGCSSTSPGGRLGRTQSGAASWRSRSPRPTVSSQRALACEE
jgi:hypothetical protein